MSRTESLLQYRPLLTNTVLFFVSHLEMHFLIYDDVVGTAITKNNSISAQSSRTLSFELVICQYWLALLNRYESSSLKFFE